MENFFCGDRFCSDLSDLMDVFDIDDEKLNELENGWSAEIEEGSLQKIFVLKKDFIKDVIIEQTERWDDRFPEEPDSVFDDIEEAINQSIDIDKLNELLPSLYYPNGKTQVVTKSDLIQYCS